MIRIHKKVDDVRWSIKVEGGKKNASSMHCNLLWKSTNCLSTVQNLAERIFAAMAGTAAATDVCMGEMALSVKSI